MRPVLVHGGGKPIDRAMAEAGLKPRKVQGRRYTDEETLAIVVRVLLQEINVGIERQIRQLGGRAVGPHLGSLQYLMGEKLLLPGHDGEPIDLGSVGKVTKVDVDLIRDFCAAGVVPVIPSLAIDAAGQWLNVNADTAAAAVAGQLHAEKLVLLTDTPGILLDRKDPGSLLSSLNKAECEKLMQAKRDRRGHDPQGGGVPGSACRRVRRRPTSSMAGSSIRCCWRFTPTAASARKLCCRFVPYSGIAW